MTTRSTQPASTRCASLAAALSANPRTKLLITVHLDPSAHDVAAVSRDRARTLGLWLQEHGVRAGQIEAFGCGATRPLAAARGSAAVNERLELALIQPLPRLGMPSTLRCEPVALPLSAAAAPRRVEACGGGAPAEFSRNKLARAPDFERNNLPLLDRAPRAGVRSRRGFVSK